MNAIVLSFERLHLGFLGCYGNHWIETPNFDRLAARAVVFDQHFGTYFGKSSRLPAWWTGWHELHLPDGSSSQVVTVPELLRSAGVATWLLREHTDESADNPSPGFEHVLDVGGYDEFDGDYAETPFAKLISTGIDQIRTFSESPNRRWLLWLQSRGVPTPWLPPEPFATLYLDEVTDVVSGELSEKEASRDVAALLERLDDVVLSGGRTAGSDGSVPQLSDLDWRLSRAVYAGYVSLLDHRLGKLLDMLDELSAQEPVLLVIVAASGESLGESDLVPHQSIGLREEIVHTPLLIAKWGNLDSGTRNQTLVQTVDLAPTLLEWFDVSANACGRDGQSILPWVYGQNNRQREFACFGEESGLLGIRTSEFYLIEQSADESGVSSARRRAFFVKPEDVWELNTVTDQMRVHAEQLSQKLRQFCAKPPNPLA